MVVIKTVNYVKLIINNIKEPPTFLGRTGSLRGALRESVHRFSFLIHRTRMLQDRNRKYQQSIRHPYLSVQPRKKGLLYKS